MGLGLKVVGVRGLLRKLMVVCFGKPQCAIECRLVPRILPNMSRTLAVCHPVVQKHLMRSSKQDGTCLHIGLGLFNRFEPNWQSWDYRIGKTSLPCRWVNNRLIGMKRTDWHVVRNMIPKIVTVRGQQMVGFNLDSLLESLRNGILNDPRLPVVDNSKPVGSIRLCHVTNLYSMIGLEGGIGKVNALQNQVPC